MNRNASLPVLLLTVAAALGCGEPPVAPTTRSDPKPTPVPSGSSLIQGQVIDADSRVPVAAAVVSTDIVCYTGTPYGGCVRVDNPAQVTADGNGQFVLSALLPQTWTEVMLQVTRTGYEPLGNYVLKANADRASLAAYPTLTIRPGESLRVNVAWGVEACGWLSYNCRRVAVVLPTSGVVEIEVTGDNGPLGLISNGDPINSGGYPTVLSVARSEVWILGAGTGTLRARER